MLHKIFFHLSFSIYRPFSFSNILVHSPLFISSLSLSPISCVLPSPFLLYPTPISIVSSLFRPCQSPSPRLSLFLCYHSLVYLIFCFIPLCLCFPCLACASFFFPTIRFSRIVKSSRFRAMFILSLFSFPRPFPFSLFSTLTPTSISNITFSPSPTLSPRSSVASVIQALSLPSPSPFPFLSAASLSLCRVFLFSLPSHLVSCSAPLQLPSIFLAIYFSPDRYSLLSPFIAFSFSIPVCVLT